MLKNKQKLQQRKQLGMHHEGDRIDENLDNELFKLDNLRRSAELSKLRKETAGYDIKDDDDRPVVPVEGTAFNEEMDVRLSDDEVEDTDLRAAKRGVQAKDESESDKDQSGSEDEEVKPEPKKFKKGKLTPTQLAMAEKLVYSSKTRSELEDWSWNRYTSNDTGN